MRYRAVTKLRHVRRERQQPREAVLAQRSPQRHGFVRANRPAPPSRRRRPKPQGKFRCRLGLAWCPRSLPRNLSRAEARDQTLEPLPDPQQPPDDIRQLRRRQRPHAHPRRHRLAQRENDLGDPLRHDGKGGMGCAHGTCHERLAGRSPYVFFRGHDFWSEVLRCSRVLRRASAFDPIRQKPSPAHTEAHRNPPHACVPVRCQNWSASA